MKEKWDSGFHITAIAGKPVQCFCLLRRRGAAVWHIVVATAPYASGAHRAAVRLAFPDGRVQRPWRAIHTAKATAPALTFPTSTSKRRCVALSASLVSRDEAAGGRGEAEQGFRSWSSYAGADCAECCVQWADGYLVTSAGTTNGSWVVVLSKGAPYLQQVGISPTSPASCIVSLGDGSVCISWARSRHLTIVSSVACDSEHSDLHCDGEPQVVELDYAYPSDAVHQRWAAGYRITACASTSLQTAVRNICVGASALQVATCPLDDVRARCLLALFLRCDGLEPVHVCGRCSCPFPSGSRPAMRRRRSATRPGRQTPLPRSGRLACETFGSAKHQ